MEVLLTEAVSVLHVSKTCLNFPASPVEAVSSQFATPVGVAEGCMLVRRGLVIGFLTRLRVCFGFSTVTSRQMHLVANLVVKLQWLFWTPLGPFSYDSVIPKVGRLTISPRP